MHHAAPLLAVPPGLERVLPHLAGFFPEARLLPLAAAPPEARLLTWPGLPAPTPGADPGPRPAGYLHLAPGPWLAPRFGGRQGVVALLAMPGASARAETLALATAPIAPAGAAPADLAPLRLAPGEALLVLDPCRPDQAAAAAAMLRQVLAGAAGRPVLLAASPAAPPGAQPVLDPAAARLVPGRPSVWLLAGLAATWHGLDEAVLLAGLLAGVAVHHHADAAWAGQSPATRIAALLAATRCADPFRHRPWSLAEAATQLAEWRETERQNRAITALTGMEWYKRGRMRRALAAEGLTPRFLQRGSAAIAAARRQGGAVACWAAITPPALRRRADAAGVPLVQIEDGFIRSAGLGVMQAPPLSMVLDGRGIHFDPARESALEHLLATHPFEAPLLARAARLRAALLAGRITKYNLGGEAPPLDLPPGRRVLLVPGQVEDDAAVRRGGGRLCTNLALLEAVRSANPDAFLLYKPHPDVEAGLRRGAVPPGRLAALADAVARHTPIAVLYPRVAEVHTMGSLTGFEALLRGLRVVTYGQPFYAGWGLTEDREPPPRRGRALPLEALVAAALILYPRYHDPVTGLPCPVEVALERLAEAPPAPPPRLPGWLRVLVGRWSHLWAAAWAAR